MRVLSLLTVFASAAAFSPSGNLPPQNDISSMIRSRSALNYMFDDVLLVQMERQRIVEEVRKTGVQLKVPEPTYAASIQDEVQQRTTAFATPVQAAIARAQKNLRHGQQVQEALRYFDEKEAR